MTKFSPEDHQSTFDRADAIAEIDRYVNKWRHYMSPAEWNAVEEVINEAGNPPEDEEVKRALEYVRLREIEKRKSVEECVKNHLF